MKTLKERGDYIIIKTETPYHGVQQFLNYNIDIKGENENYYLEFRWSVDNKTFSSWINLTTNNLRNVDTTDTEKIWLQIKIINVSPEKEIEVDINSFKIEYDSIDFNKYKNALPPNLVCLESGNWAEIGKIPDLCFKPYDVNPAICLYEELSYSVNKLFGHDVEYFRAVADKRGEDVVLKEYTLYDVEDSKCLKVMVPDNEFPDNALQHNPFGINFETPFEVHIDKNVWWELFPEGSGPQKRDIIYFPLTNRIYEVISSYMFRGFMEKETYWKVSLVKYSPKTNRKENDDFKNIVDTLSTNMKKEFSEEVKETEIKETKPQQYTPDTTDRKKDPIRKWLHDNLVIVNKPIKNYGTIISEQHYDLRNLIEDKKNIAVEYLPSVELKNNLSYSAWISEDYTKVFNPTDSVEGMSNSDNKLLIKINKKRDYQIGDYLKIFKGSDLIFYGQVSNVKNNNQYELNVNKKIIDDLNKNYSIWDSIDGYSIEKIVPSNLIYGYDEEKNKGIKINLFAHKFLEIIINGEQHLFIFDKPLQKTKWCAIFINISNLFKQIEVNIWERKWIDGVLSSPQTTELFNIYNNTINDFSFDKIKIDKNYQLLPGNHKITNIRLFNAIAEIEKQSTLLNQNIVKDAQNAIIIDNAIDRYYLPRITR